MFVVHAAPLRVIAGKLFGRRIEHLAIVPSPLWGRGLG